QRPAQRIYRSVPSVAVAAPPPHAERHGADELVAADAGDLRPAQPCLRQVLSPRRGRGSLAPRGIRGRGGTPPARLQLGGSRSQAVLSSAPARFSYVERAACVCGEPLTDSARAIVLEAAWGHVRFVACPVCRSWCQSPRIAPQSLSAWYDSEHYQGSPGVAGSAYVDYVGDEAERVAEARRRYRRDLAPYLPPGRGRVLEVGCATGSLLSVLRDAGHDVTGIDLSPRFAAVARQRYGLDVIVADVMSADVPGDRFDIVVLLGTAANLPHAAAPLPT